MFLVFKALSIVVLLVLFVQDIKSRAVYWLLFPLLIGLSVALRLMKLQPIIDIGEQALINISFLTIQLLLVSIWFSLKQKRWVNLTHQLLGWGDILFLISIAFYLSTLNFIIFYVISLLLSLIIWITWQLISKNKSSHIPLAGLQAFWLMLFIFAEGCTPLINLTNDDWLQSLIQ